MCWNHRSPACATGGCLSYFIAIVVRRHFYVQWFHRCALLVNLDRVVRSPYRDYGVHMGGFLLVSLVSAVQNNWLATLGRVRCPTGAFCQIFLEFYRVVILTLTHQSRLDVRRGLGRMRIDLVAMLRFQSTQPPPQDTHEKEMAIDCCNTILFFVIGSRAWQCCCCSAWYSMGNEVANDRLVMREQGISTGGNCAF